MNTNYGGAGFDVKVASLGADPVAESTMQSLSFMSGREQQYGFQPHGHAGEMFNMGVQPHHQLHMPPPFNNPQLNPDQPSHPYQDGVTSCLHGDRHVGFAGSGTGHQHMIEPEFNQFAEAQTRECFSQQQRLAAMPDYQLHSHPNGNHAVPAPCLPLDQSPNRAASFHGLSSSSPENNRPEPYRLFPQGRVTGSQYCYPCDPLPGNFDMTPNDTSEPKLNYCETGSQMVGGNFSIFKHGNSTRAPLIGGSKVDQLPQQNAYSERFGNRGKMEPGGPARHHLIPHQRAGPMGRQNSDSPVLPRLYHTPDFVPDNQDIQNSNAVAHGPHEQLDHPINRLNNHNHNMHPFGDPTFNAPQFGPQPPHQQHLNSFPYLNMTKRPRFDAPNGSAGENCRPLRSSLHNRAGLENHLSPSAFPNSMGEFTAHVTDGFQSGLPPMNCGPHQQQPLPRQQNAAMMIKQMASRNQQQRMRQADVQPISHHGDVNLNGMVHRGPLGNMSHFNYEKKHHFLGHFDTQSHHLPHENSWFPDPHQQCRESNLHSLEPPPQNGHNDIFRPTVDIQALNSPAPQNQFDSSVNSHLPVGTSEDGTVQPSASMDRRPNEFGGAAIRRQQHNFPPGGPNQQGTPQSNPPDFGSSPGNYPSHPEYISSQHLSVNKLGALSLGNLNKASTKDSVFGQSCLAALSTACQNMIASLGAPNLNVTFNKKSQNEAKRKPGQVEKDINSNSGVGFCGPGSEYFQGNASQNSQTPCSGNNNNGLASQNTLGQMAKREPTTLSPDNTVDSGNEGKGAVGSGRGRGKRRRDSGHVSPGNFSPSCSSNPVVSPGQQASSLSMNVEGRGRTPESVLVSPSFGKPDLTTSVDSGIQSMGKSDGVSPCMDYFDDASPNYSNEDGRTNRTSMKCALENRTSFPDTPCMEQVRTPLDTSTQDEVHPLEILQAQIQLQRQQFSISEDQALGAKSGKKTSDCQAGLNGDCALTSNSPESGKGSANTIDLDSLMTEQHATWYGSSNKALIEDSRNGKCMGFWDRARGQNDNKEGHG